MKQNFGVPNYPGRGYTYTFNKIAHTYYFETNAKCNVFLSTYTIMYVSDIIPWLTDGHILTKQKIRK